MKGYNSHSIGEDLAEATPISENKHPSIKVCVYARVSTQEQGKNGYSIDAQISDIEAYCKLKRWNIYKRYIDSGFSGRNTKRPSYLDMMNNLECCDMIVCHKMDRLHRNLYNSVKMLKRLDKRGVGFCSVSESIDTSTPFGGFFFNVINSISQLESSLIGQRTKTAMQQKAKQGKRVGSKIPYGYFLKDNDLVIIGDQASIIRHIYYMYLDNKLMNEICEYLNQINNKKWYPSTIAGILKNPTYAGYLKYDSYVYKGTHDPILSIETFNEVQRIIRSRGGSSILIEVE